MRTGITLTLCLYRTVLLMLIWEIQIIRGRRMARAAVEELVGNKPDQEILFGGTSAGGRGSMVLIDFIHDLVHDTTTIRGVHDSGAYQDIQPYVSSYTPFGEQCKRAFEMYAPPVSEICREEFTGELWKCICGEYMLPRVMTPSQVLIYLYDSYQLSNAVGKSPAHWDPEMCRYVEDLFRPDMEETVADIVSNPEHVVFAPACYDHGIMTSSKFQSIKVEGISAEDQLLTWLSGFKEDVMSSCAGVNCQETCEHVGVGDDALC
ncbi:palmitoleoyl-protein carboxylesterase NOTUM isoform X3 [Eurytemora carolleeae]|uniref:palmitoleoyl-protein carboxylesterase NOTUM isoform X3 n=1 Tax=Eurytemora carolleeae TaxID=1294199 RepID=UPI000C76F0C7|nr:palmitoleoyl-protein carboxylesterase NOTUM isoform X3 [Eurytemora carolleeae]|eukprot:XP_023340527.1 palmitoleoyl-protein carboxylesterase NOTUM-like isoform X3 [Eurytemora affinis]